MHRMHRRPLKTKSLDLKGVNFSLKDENPEYVHQVWGLELMAYAHEIKFFIKDKELYAALFDKPPFFCNEFWIKNVRAKELGISKLPEGLQLEKNIK
jgi:hypothetical protein